MNAIDKDDLAARVAQWMRDVMRRREWTAEQWARLADTSPTNITRLVNSGASHVPNAHTLAKLGAAAGEPPPLLPDGKMLLTRTLPRCGARELREVYDNKSLGALAAMQLRPSEVHVPAETPQSYAAVRVEADTMSAIGISVGDTLVVDLLAPPAHGQMVCALIGGKIAAMIYAPPYLIPQSTSPAWKPTPLDAACVVGVCKQQIRSFA